MTLFERVRATVDVLTSVLVAGAAATLIVSVANKPKATAQAAARFGPALERIDARQQTIPLINAGEARHAPIALIEFSDFECPFCGKFAKETLPRVRSEFINTGRVVYEFRNYPLESIHHSAAEAAKAAVCAREIGQFWPMHDWLFDQQKSLATESISKRMGELGGPSTAALAGCLQRAEDLVQGDKSEGRRLGVNATPTLFVGRVTANGLVSLTHRVSGAATFESLRDAFVSLDAETKQPNR